MTIPTPAAGVRQALAAVPEYQAGRLTTPQEAMAAGEALLSSNEMPWSPPGELISALDTVSGILNRYPSMANGVLRGMLAERFGLDIENIALGCGGVEIGRQVAMAVLEAGDEVVFGRPSFQEFQILAQLHGAVPVPVEMSGLTHDLDAMAAAVTDRTRLLIICNPNNPTGTGVQTEQIAALLERIPSRCLVLVDEAYWEFVGDDLGPSAASLVRKFDNVAVLRTFSKAYGIAGARVGYGLASATVASAMRKCQLPFSVNLLGEALAVSALANEELTMARVAEVRRLRDEARERLLKRGYDVPVSYGNFLFLTGQDGIGLAAACEQAGIAVRPIGNDGSRVTIGDRDETERFLVVAEAFLGTSVTSER